VGEARLHLGIGNEIDERPGAGRDEMAELLVAAADQADDVAVLEVWKPALFNP
jgi:hypothetical protein